MVSYEPGDTPKLRLVRHGRYTDVFSDIKYPVLYGKLLSGEYITFTDPFPIRKEQSSNGTALLELATNLLFAGSETTSMNADYRSAEMMVSGLSAWISGRSLNGNIKKKRGDWIHHVTHTSKVHFEEYIKTKEDGFRLRMSNVGNSNQSDDRQELTNYEVLHVTPRSRKGHRYYTQKSWKLAQYFSLMSRHPFEVQSIVLRSKISKNDRNRAYDARFALVYPVKQSRKIVKQKRHEIIFHQSDISDRVRITLSKFLSSDSGFSTAAAIFHSIRLEPPSVDLRLLLLVQAYEAAFSEKHTGRIVTKAKFREIKKTMQDAISDEVLAAHPDFIKAIDRALGHANSKSVREKMILQLESMNKLVVKKLIITNSDECVRKIVDTRNYITHRTEASRTRYVVDGPEMINIAESLKWMIWYMLLKDIGFSKKVLSEKIVADPTFNISQRDRIQSSFN